MSARSDPQTGRTKFDPKVVEALEAIVQAGHLRVAPPALVEGLAASFTD